MRVPEGICRIRNDGVIGWASASFLKMIGRVRRDVTGKRRFSDLLESEAERKRFEILCLDARREGAVENSEFHLRRPGGSRFPVSVDLRSVPMRGGRGRLIRARVEDISYIRERERHLARSRDAYFNMMKDLHASLVETRELLEELIYAFANAIDAKSHWTMGHSRRVAGYAVAVAEEMGLDRKSVEDLKTAALLHDIGKIGTYDEILDKPDELTEDEYELVKKHPLKGIGILAPISKMEAVLPAIIHHHERVDGTGYPGGLEDGEIPLPARILAVADAYDSMTAERPYRPSLGKGHAAAELRRLSGTQFDAEVVSAFLRVAGNLPGRPPADRDDLPGLQGEAAARGPVRTPALKAPSGGVEWKRTGQAR